MLTRDGYIKAGGTPEKLAAWEKFCKTDPEMMKIIADGCVEQERIKEIGAKFKRMFEAGAHDLVKL
jgi:hypothetical protein